MNAATSLPALETMVRCRVAAAAAVLASAETIALWRKQPVGLGAEKMPVSFLKHVEDQTVLGLMTVRAALERQGWQGRSFADWGVIAAGSLFGRASIAQAIQRFAQEGAWGVSPNLVPHQSLHAITGTISQALRIHGPNFGVNGGPNAGPDAFLIAAALMMDGRLPGLWLVLTGYESEWVPAADGSNPPMPRCQAVALALTPSQPNAEGLHLSIGQALHDGAEELSITFPDFQLGLLMEELSASTGQPAAKWRLADGYWLELESTIHEPEGRP